MRSSQCLSVSSGEFFVDSVYHPPPSIEMSIGYSLDKVLLVVLCAVLFSCTAIQAKECGYKPTVLGIINGTDAYENEIPWQVSLRVYNQTTNVDRHFCGGSIIADDWVLTSARCVDLHDNVTTINEKNFRVMVGAHMLSNPSKNARLFKVKQIYVHPDWDSQKILNDVALVELSQPIGLNSNNSNLNAICLGSPFHQTEGKSAIISGWGYINFFYHYASDILQRATVTVESQEQCKDGSIYKDLTFENVCAGRTTGTCKGDSGGPLQYEIDGRWYQLGIATSRVKICGLSSFPSLYSRVPYYLDFIRHVTGITPP